MKTSAGVSDTKRKEILGILLITLAVFTWLSLFSYEPSADNQSIREVRGPGSAVDIFSRQFSNQCGPVGAGVSYVVLRFLGYAGYFIPLFLMLFGIGSFPKFGMARVSRKVFYVFLFVLVLGMLTSLPAQIDPPAPISGEETVSERVTVGGEIAAALAGLCLVAFRSAGSYVLLVALLIMLATMFTPFKPSDVILLCKRLLERLWTKGRKWRELRRIHRQRVRREKELRAKEKAKEKAKRKSEEESRSVAPVTQIAASADEKEPVSQIRPVKKEKTALKLVRAGEKRAAEGGYRFPSLDLLDDPPDARPSLSEEELNQTARTLKETLSTFGVEIESEKIEIHPGPVITRYEFKPAAGIKVNQVVNLADDLALAMKARKVRIEAPVPGKAAIGVEIPNRVAEMVYLKQILTSPSFQDTKSKLTLAFGKTSAGEPFVTDLGKMPHLLVAGATGSGKSVCINAITTSLLYRLPPEEVRFVMIDPKMLELSVYEGIPHLERSVITNPKVAEHVLFEIVTEMEERYKKLAKCGVRNIEDFNRKQKKEEILPYIIIIVDELADLMMSSSSRVEALITRLAQMARAVGIHLILATQRPSVDVITGLIKANFSARIAFQVASKIDSRTILDCNGAEKLLGSGDMLFIETGHPEPRRLHGAFISSEETSRIVEFIKGQDYTVEPTEMLSTEPEEVIINQDAERDNDLFRRAAELVIRHKQGSVSLLQRRLAIGYQRAARLIDQLEEEGVVGPYDGSKAREVLVDALYLEGEKFRQRKNREDN